MTFSPAQIAALSAPLERKHVKSREQGGRQLSYIEGYHAENEANRIFGFHAWDRETIDLRVVSERTRKIGKGQYEKDGWGVSYLAKVRVMVFTPEGRSVIREGIGAGHGIDVDLGQAHESAAKEAETDAEKRALKTFGNPFGQALYDKSQSQVADTPVQKNPSVSVQPEGPDWWGAEGSGMSAAQAKKEGWGDTFDGWLGVVPMIPTAAAWKQWCADNADDIKQLPKGWRIQLREEVEVRGRELGALT